MLFRSIASVYADRSEVRCVFESKVGPARLRGTGVGCREIGWVRDQLGRLGRDWVGQGRTGCVGEKIGWITDATDGQSWVGGGGKEEWGVKREVKERGEGRGGHVGQMRGWTVGQG